MNNPPDPSNTHFTSENSGTSPLDPFPTETTDTVQPFTCTCEVSPDYHPLQGKPSTPPIVTDFDGETWEITDNEPLDSFPKGGKPAAPTTSVLSSNTTALASEGQTTFSPSQQLVTEDKTADLSRPDKAKDHNSCDGGEEPDLDWVWDAAEDDVDSEDLSESEEERDLVHDPLIPENLELLSKADIRCYLPNCVTLLGVLWKQFGDWKISWKNPDFDTRKPSNHTNPKKVPTWIYDLDDADFLWWLGQRKYPKGELIPVETALSWHLYALLTEENRKALRIQSAVRLTINKLQSENINIYLSREDHERGLRRPLRLITLRQVEDHPWGENFPDLQFHITNIAPLQPKATQQKRIYQLRLDEPLISKSEGQFDEELKDEQLEKKTLSSKTKSEPPKTKGEILRTEVKGSVSTKPSVLIQGNTTRSPVKSIKSTDASPKKAKTGIQFSTFLREEEDRLLTSPRDHSLKKEYLVGGKRSVRPYTWKTGTKGIQKALKAVALDKYKAQFKTKPETDDLEAAESESATASKSKTKKAEMSGTWWQVKAQEEQKKLEELRDLKEKQKSEVKKGGGKRSKPRDIDGNSTTSGLLVGESSEDEEGKTATPKAVSAPNDLKSWFRQLPLRRKDIKVGYQHEYIIWQFGDGPGQPIIITTGIQPSPNVFVKWKLFDMQYSEKVMDAITTENILDYIPINVKLSDFWLAFLIHLGLSRDFLNNNWKADAAKESIHKTRENCGAPATLKDDKGHFYFVKLQGMFQMCEDMIKFCNTPKAKNKKEFKATQEWEKGELLLLTNGPALPDTTDPHQKFKANMVSSSAKHQASKTRNSSRGPASKKQKQNPESSKSTPQKLTTQKANAKDGDESDESSGLVGNLANIHIKKEPEVMTTTENSSIDTRIQKLAIDKLWSITVFANQNHTIVSEMMGYINEVLDAMPAKQMEIPKDLASVIAALESARERVAPTGDIAKAELSTKYPEIAKRITHHKVTDGVFTMRKKFEEWAQDDKATFEEVFHDEGDLMPQGERKRKGKGEAKRIINPSLFTHPIS